jgi:hypothetical protein
MRGDNRSGYQSSERHDLRIIFIILKTKLRGEEKTKSFSFPDGTYSKRAKTQKRNCFSSGVKSA